MNTVVDSGLIQTYSGLIQAYSRLIQTYSGLIQVYSGLIQAYSGLIPDYSGVIQAYPGLIQAWSGLIQAYSRLIQAYSGFFRLNEGFHDRLHNISAPYCPHATEITNSQAYNHDHLAAYCICWCRVQKYVYKGQIGVEKAEGFLDLHKYIYIYISEVWGLCVVLWTFPLTGKLASFRSCVRAKLCVCVREIMLLYAGLDILESSSCFASPPLMASCVLHGF